jgi:hypothetical protein
MTSFRQIDANRRNARKSTGPITEEGKHRPRRNAVRHGLTAETVIEVLEDPEDYKAVELSVTANFDAQTSVHLLQVRSEGGDPQSYFAVHESAVGDKTNIAN